MIETHRSFANTWECDENAHINVQFYLKRFEEACDVYLALCGNSIRGGDLLLSRHVRYHKEVHAGDSLYVKSAAVDAGKFPGSLAHFLFNATTNALCATAVDSFAVNTELNIPQTAEPLSERERNNAAPRGLTEGLAKQFNSTQLLEANRAMVSQYNIVRDHDLDAGGNFLTSRVVSMFTDGAPHIWEAGGVTTQWLNQTGNGRVAVEMKVCPFVKPAAGDALRLVSRISEIEGRTMQIDHQIERIGDRQVIAAGNVRCLVMNLTTRKAVSLPESVTKILTVDPKRLTPVG